MSGANHDVNLALEYELSELGNARRIAKSFGYELRYVQEWGWLAWDGMRWKRDELGMEIVAAKDIITELQNDAAKLAAEGAEAENNDKSYAAELMLKWARRSSAARVIESSAKLARTEQPIAASASNFDADPWALNVTNGTIDLRTGELRPHCPEDWHTMLAPVAYDPHALCPTWDNFIAWALPDDDVRSWFQRFIGYCLTGEVSEQVLTFLHGGGANGKSTSLGAIKYVWGEYAVQGSPGLIMSPDHGNGEELARRQRAMLKGRRLVLVQEIEAGRYLNEAQVKQLTGGDMYTAAKLYQNEIEIEPTHKIAIATNYKPVVRGSDRGIWRRIRLVPFVAQIADADKDPELPKKLREEAPGILAWAVRGCLAWQRDGLSPPRAMVSAAEGYRQDEDRLGEFLADHTEQSGEVSSRELYRRYKAWCEERGEKPWTQRALIHALTERGYKAGRPSIGGQQVRGLVGLSLKHSSVQGG